MGDVQSDIYIYKYVPPIVLHIEVLILDIILYVIVYNKHR